MKPEARPAGRGNTAAAVRMSGVYAGYNGSTILSGVDLEIKHGECVAVVGPSGSGKTTLLRVIAGLLPPLAGEIHCVANSAASRSAVGYIPQHVGLVKNRTALQNVLLGALGRLSGWRSLLGSFPTSERKAADEALTRVGLAGRGADRIETLSGGEKRRVAIARALVQRPELLLADEFLADVDKVTAKEIFALLEKLRRSTGMTTIIVDHDVDAARRVADRVIVIVDGQKVREVSPSDVSVAGLADLFRAPSDEKLKN